MVENYSIIFKYIIAKKRFYNSNGFAILSYLRVVWVHYRSQYRKLRVRCLEGVAGAKMASRRPLLRPPSFGHCPLSMPFQSF